MRRTNDPSVVVMQNPSAPVSEEYRSLCANIQFSAAWQHTKVLLVTSPSAGEGKSTTAVNLAAAYAQAGKKTLIVDANFRKPGVHEKLGQTAGPGLSDAIAESRLLPEMVKASEWERLYWMAAGTKLDRPYELAASAKLPVVLNELREEFDLIVIDSSSVLDDTNARVLASYCDGVLLVVRSGRSKGERVRKAKAALEYVGARVLGAVLNRKHA